MSMDSVGTMVQQGPVGTGSDVTDLVVKDLSDRREAGTKKYGMPLRSHNGRSSLVDAYQESIDMTLYLRQKVEEERNPAGGAPAPDIELTDRITVRSVQATGGDHMVVAAARVSTNGEEALRAVELQGSEASAGLINYLMKHRHGTPFEHASMTFFVHAPIFVWREWHRHRIGFSYNEESARYKQLKPVFWIPRPDRNIVPAEGHTPARPKFGPGTEHQMRQLRSSLEESYRQSYATYSALIDAGFAKEVARACLPVGIYSSCWVTCNPRSLMSFLSLRVHEPSATFVSYPQAEIEQAAKAAEQIFAEWWPLTYEAFVKNGRVAP